MTKVKVLYIAGWGRSGSTILDNVLDQTDGYLSVAELYQIWNFGLLEGGSCGCGEPIVSCPLWKPVLERAYGSIDQARPANMIRWRDHYVRTRYLPLINLFASGLLKAEAGGLQHLDALYRSIAEETGCRVIVDSSKHPIYGALLSQLPSVDLYLVHLVRHPSAVAHSWQRKKLMLDAGKDFHILSPQETAVYWIVWNSGIEAFGRSLRGKHLLIRYEDFTTDPQGELRRIYRLLGEEPHELPVDSQGRFTMLGNHTVIGNPVKYNRGAITIRTDSEWQERFPASSRRLVTALTWPLMLKYGYRY